MRTPETKTRQVYKTPKGSLFARGSILPSTRELARELGGLRSLIVEVYEQLTAEGYLEGRQGSGYR
ncbi:GntR family transcriptional regulator [Brevibacillus fluminis]|uniref:GntR family transcriptional regulator n=1 Tax=Brevibacillus fluminis TaxID=511487 RepID=A0A3M8DA13_9BACL|nr:GntR family transcriptional regulator [Brevibacillus fluminis]